MPATLCDHASAQTHNKTQRGGRLLQPARGFVWSVLWVQADPASSVVSGNAAVVCADKQSGLLLRAPYLANVLQQPFYSTSIMSRLVKMAEGHIESLVAQEGRDGAAEAAAAGAGGHHADSSSQRAAAAAAEPGQPAAADAGAADTTQPATPVPAGAGECMPAAATAAAPAAPAGDAAAGSSGDDGAVGAMSDTDTEELLVGTAVCARTRVALQTWQQLCSNASTPSTILPANSSQALVRALQVRQRWAKIVSMAPIMTAAGMEAPAAQQQAAANGGAQQDGAGQVPPAEQPPPQQQQRKAEQQDGASPAAVGQKHKVGNGSRAGHTVQAAHDHHAEACSAHPADWWLLAWPCHCAPPVNKVSATSQCILAVCLL